MAFKIIRNDITNVYAGAAVNAIGHADATRRGVSSYNARYVLDEVLPSWIDGNHDEVKALRQWFDNCLIKAMELNCESIAIPLVTACDSGYPRDISLQVAISAFRKFLLDNELEIILVIHDRDNTLSDSMFDGVRSFVEEKFLVRDFDGYESRCYGAPEPMPMMAAPCSSVSSEDTIKSKKKGIFKRPKKESGSRRAAETFMLGSAPMPAPMPEFSSRETLFREEKPSKPLDVYVGRFENQDILSFGEYLQQLINKKGLTNKEVYFESNLTKQYFSKLINNKVSAPAKEKLLCIAVALKLNIDETRDFLLHAGYALSPYSKIDLVFEYYIRAGKYDVYEISFALEDVGVEGGLWPELA